MPANPNDPGQFLNWDQPYLQLGRQAMGMNLYDPAVTAQISKMFGPLFQQQQGLLSNAQSRGMSQSGQSAGAFAASRNLANPGSYMSSARQRVAEQYAPEYGKLAASQTAQTLAATEASQKFNAANLWQQASQYQQIDAWKLQKWLADMASENQPSGFESMMSGLIKGVATVGGAMIGGPAGAALGYGATSGIGR